MTRKDAKSRGCFKCRLCDRFFTRSEHRTRHERIHSSERPYACNRCSSTFFRRDLLIRHLRMVHRLQLAKNDPLPPPLTDKEVEERAATAAARVSEAQREQREHAALAARRRQMGQMGQMSQLDQLDHQLDQEHIKQELELGSTGPGSVTGSVGGSVADSVTDPVADSVIGPGSVADSVIGSVAGSMAGSMAGSVAVSGIDVSRDTPLSRGSLALGLDVTTDPRDYSPSLSPASQASHASLAHPSPLEALSSIPLRDIGSLCDINGDFRADLSDPLPFGSIAAPFVGPFAALGDAEAPPLMPRTGSQSSISQSPHSPRSSVTGASRWSLADAGVPRPPLDSPPPMLPEALMETNFTSHAAGFAPPDAFVQSLIHDDLPYNPYVLPETGLGTMYGAKAPDTAPLPLNFGMATAVIPPDTASADMSDASVETYALMQREGDCF